MQSAGKARERQRCRASPRQPPPRLQLPEQDRARPGAMLEPTCKLPGRRASTGPQCWLGLTLAPPAQLYGANTPMLRPPPARLHGHAHSTQARQPRIGPAPVITPDRQPCRRPACGSSHQPLTTEGGSEARQLVRRGDRAETRQRWESRLGLPAPPPKRSWCSDWPRQPPFHAEAVSRVLSLGVTLGPHRSH